MGIYSDQRLVGPDLVTTEAEPGYYQIINENYLEEPQYIYWRIDPTSTPSHFVHFDVPSFIGFALDGAPNVECRGAYRNFGSEIETTVSPLRDLDVGSLQNSPTPEWTQVLTSQLYQLPLINDFAVYPPYNIYPTGVTGPPKLFFGLINRTMTGSSTIGYIRHRQYASHIVSPYDGLDFDLFAEDGTDFLGVLSSPLFAHPKFANGTVNPIATMGGWVRVWAGIMKWMNDQGVDHIIYDITNNPGGFRAPFAHAVGARRPGFGGLSLYPNRDYLRSVEGGVESVAMDGDKNLEFYYSREDTFEFFADGYPGAADFELKSSYEHYDDQPEIRPDIVEELYGEDYVFKNGKFIILANQKTVSAGPVHMHFMLGANQDGDIGNGVQVKFVGAFDPRNEGTNRGEMSRFSYPLYTENSPFECPEVSAGGFAMQCKPLRFQVESEGVTVFYDENGDPHHTSAQRNLSPGLRPVGGKANGPLSDELDDTIHQDCGFITPHTNPVSDPLPNGPAADNDHCPILGQRETYRSQWIEAAIRVADPTIPVPAGLASANVEQTTPAGTYRSQKANRSPFNSGDAIKSLNIAKEAKKEIPNFGKLIDHDKTVSLSLLAKANGKVHGGNLAESRNLQKIAQNLVVGHTPQRAFTSNTGGQLRE